MSTAKTNDSNTGIEAKKSASPIKAFLLSVAVFPGLGQVTQGKRLLGYSIMLVVAACTYVVLIEAFDEINAAAQRMAGSGSTDILRAHEESRAILQNLETGRFYTALYTLIAAWIFSALEVFRKT